jgi:hypothetical protein
MFGRFKLNDIHTHHKKHELIDHKVPKGKAHGEFVKYLDDTLRKLNYTNCRPEPSKTMRTPW